MTLFSEIQNIAKLLRHQFNLVRMQSPLSFSHSFSNSQLMELLFLYQYEMLEIISDENIYGVSRLEL